MVLAYQSHVRSQDVLARQLGIQPRLGAPARSVLNLVSDRLLINYGEGSLPQLKSWLNASIPVVAFVQTGELAYWQGESFQHAVVYDCPTMLRERTNEWAADWANALEVGLQRTTPVGQYAPAGNSPYGAVDMAGNVWEWCSTRWWNESQKEYNYPYTPDDGREDLSGGDDVVLWALRGHIWADEQKAPRCAVRFRNDPGKRLHYWGFRCCCATSSFPGSYF